MLEREAAGYAAIRGLLDLFIDAAIAENHPLGSFESRMYQLLKQRAPIENADINRPYGRVLRVLDYVSGMTDSFATESFRRLSGVTT